MELTTELAFDIFSWGADYGQLKMEEERDNEDLFSGFLGCIYDKKTSTPMKEPQRRQPHSENWRNAKRKSFEEFKNLLRGLL